MSAACLLILDKSSSARRISGAICGVGADFRRISFAGGDDIALLLPCGALPRR